MQRVVEVPRRLAAHVLGALVGGIFLCTGWMLWYGPSSPLDDIWLKLEAGAFVTVGAIKLVGNLQLVVRRPPALRASTEGVWFGGGPVIRWHDIDNVYMRQVAVGRPYLRSRVMFSFHRMRTLFRLPSWLWFTTPMIGQIAVSVAGANVSMAAVVAQLEALRSQAREGGAELPRAELRL